MFKFDSSLQGYTSASAKNPYLPVISISSDANVIKGNGKSDNPYIIE